MTAQIKSYLWVTCSYWGFTLTDGALRMLVVLYFHRLGYSPLEVAMLFLFYEFFGVVTNLFGGWLAARFGLKTTLFCGLFLQIAALLLLAQTQWLGVAYVMVLQALSGIAKDLNKMSAKTSIKQLIDKNQQSQLFKWVSLLTGSKNTLKGIGFFLGGALLATVGYQQALYCLAIGLAAISILTWLNLDTELKSKDYKPKFTEVFSKSSSVNWLSAARLFLFAARDVWFVVALPVFLITSMGWSSTQVGTMMACWVIVYGFFQSSTPWLFQKCTGEPTFAPQKRAALLSASGLFVVLIAMQCALYVGVNLVDVALAGLLLFAVVFAINSAIHSYLIVDYAREQGASMDVGFYYMSNAAGRLMGTVLSGVLYQHWGLNGTLIASLIMIGICLPLTFRLPQKK